MNADDDDGVVAVVGCSEGRWGVKVSIEHGGQTDQKQGGRIEEKQSHCEHDF